MSITDKYTKTIKGKNILLSASNEFLSLLIVDFLQFYGAKVRLYKEDLNDIIDLYIIDGKFDTLLEKLKEIRKISATDKSTLAIAITDFLNKAERLELLNSGFSFVLTKPFEPDNLLKNVYECLLTKKRIKRLVCKRSKPTLNANKIPPLFG